MVAIWGREEGEILVQFIAVEMEVFFHAGDVGVVDILLVEVFDHCSSGRSSTFKSFPKVDIWLTHPAKYTQTLTETYPAAGQEPVPQRSGHCLNLLARYVC